MDALLATTLSNLQDTTSHSHPFEKAIFGGTMQHEVDGEVRNLSIGNFSYGQTGWPHCSQDKIPCVFPVPDNFSLCYFYVINNS